MNNYSVKDSLYSAVVTFYQSSSELARWVSLFDLAFLRRVVSARKPMATGARNDLYTGGARRLWGVQSVPPDRYSLGYKALTKNLETGFLWVRNRNLEVDNIRPFANVS